MKTLPIKSIFAASVIFAMASFLPGTAEAGHGSQIHWNGTALHIGLNFGPPIVIHPAPPPAVKQIRHRLPRQGHHRVSHVVHHYPPAHKYKKKVYGHPSQHRNQEHKHDVQKHHRPNSQGHIPPHHHR